MFLWHTGSVLVLKSRDNISSGGIKSSQRDIMCIIWENKLFHRQNTEVFIVDF